MIVKIVWKQPEDIERYHIFEADEICWNYINDNGQEPLDFGTMEIILCNISIEETVKPKVLIKCFTDKDTKQIITNGLVYIMNNQGKTIDRIN